MVGSGQSRSRTTKKKTKGSKTMHQIKLIDANNETVFTVSADTTEDVIKGLMHEITVLFSDDFAVFGEVITNLSRLLIEHNLILDDYADIAQFPSEFEIHSAPQSNQLKFVWVFKED